MTEILTAGQSTAWTEVSRIANEGGYCGYTEGCPCCTCEESGAVTVTYTRHRWSKSRKAHAVQTSTVTLCSAHASERML